ncbi:EAL domain-containing protein [Vibrio sp. SCSIO 43136]|uniref:bifunctional diguanylate cyclase/phosphodiesterase n=1 Tax=Vibrio sp. SCSIO 43136 TaxID=2819101 RepID=UPI002075E15A|nr:EAL domain-containing protein [Vibrio sp. SCSIO 43136]USD65204.1 EAL domain-containing protein [Vibrio sp. SCSIO 43136]
MAPNKLTLRSAVILPFVIVFLVTFGVVASVQYSSYENMVEKISHKQLVSFTENIKTRLSAFLEEPFRANMTFTRTVEFSDLYEENQMQAIEDYLSMSFSHLSPYIEHLDVIGFGGKEGEFIGFRRENNDSFTLMLQDSRTQNELIIYQGDDAQSGIRSRFQNYDPRQRPWYIPAAESLQPSWSQIYANADERQEITLSAIHPVMGNEGLLGVMVSDIRINTFNSFLRQQKARTTAAMYIFDRDKRLVAHSEPEGVVSLGTKESSKGMRLLASENNNQVIAKSAEFIDFARLGDPYANFNFEFELEGERYFNKLSRFQGHYGLDWYIMVTISERDLLGELPTQQRQGLLIAIAVALVGLLFGMLAFNRITRPITSTANAAKELAKGDWNSPMPEPGNIFETSMLVSAFNNMAANLKHSFDALRSQLVFDSLTQLYSRQGLIEASCKLRSLDKGSLILLGIDRFREINDSLGHYSGDQLLVIMSERLKLQSPEGAMLARVAGDEFAVFLPCEHQHEEIEVLANRIKTSFNAPFQMGDDTVVVSISIGMVETDSSANMSTWLRNASIALSHAKQEPLRTVVYRPEMADKSRKKTQILAELNQAIAASEFVPFYQPIIDLESGEVIGAEALARWVSAEKGVIPPFEFIPVAEESGLIGEIGAQILLKSCTDTALAIHSGQWPQDFSIHVNLSVNQLSHTDFISELKTILQDTQLPAENLTLELTESRIVDNDPIILKNMQAIKQLGIKIAIDDFGTGYSSLAYLHKLPFDCLKIDRSFVDQMRQENIDTSIVAAIVNMAEGFKSNLVAEGVETSEQADLLRQLGCPQAQGYLFSHPMPFADWPTNLVNMRRDSA